jgi:hypothetical protein
MNAQHRANARPSLPDRLVAGTDDSPEHSGCDVRREAAERILALETTIVTFLHDIDARDDRLRPITMTTGMWLQVQAFRKLLDKA